jgi:DNA repair protein RecO (recombination protein O)
LRAFELALLRQLGWLPELAQATLTAQPLDPQAEYALDPEAGLVRRSPGLSGAVWVALEAALGHGHPAALRAACAAAAQPLRAALQPLLHYHLGHQPLRTRQVRQGLQRLVESR